VLRTAPGCQFRRRVELLAADAVQALVVPAVQVAARGAGTPEALDSGSVPRVAAGADEVVDAEAERLGQAEEGGGVGVDELLHSDSRRLRGKHVLERVVVGPRLEPDLLVEVPAVPGEHVGLHELEREAQVRARVDVRDRRGDVAACHRNLQVDRGLRPRKYIEAPWAGPRKRTSVQRQRPRGRGISWLKAFMRQSYPRRRAAPRE